MNKLDMKKVILFSGVTLALISAGGIVSHNAHGSTINAKSVYITGNRIANLNINTSGKNSQRSRKGPSRYRSHFLPSNADYHHVTNHKSKSRTYNAHKKSYVSNWRYGVPKALSSSTGWISNIKKTNYSSRGYRYLRYTTPLYSGGRYSEGFNARAHFYMSRKSKAGSQIHSGITSGAKGSQTMPYYRYRGRGVYNIISGNNAKNGLHRDLEMLNHPSWTNYYTPTYVTVKALGNNTIKIWNRSRYMGVFHRMLASVASGLGY